MQRVGVIITRIMVLAACLTCLTIGTAQAQTDHYKAGLDAFNAGKYPEAEAALLNAEHDPLKAKAAKQLLAFVYMNQNRLADAERVLGELTKYADEAGTVQGLAWLNFYKGDYAGADKLFRKEIDWARDHMGKTVYNNYYKRDDKMFIESIVSDGRFGLGLIAERQNRLDEAVKQTDLATEYKNMFVGRKKIYTKLGDLYYAQKKYSDALVAYRKAVSTKADETRGKDLEAQDAVALLKAGWTNYELKKLDDAAKLFEQVLNTGRYPADARYGLTLTHVAQGKADLAQADLTMLFDLNPYAAEVSTVYALIEKTPALKSLWKPWGLAYYKLGDPASALYKLAGYIDQVSKTDYEAMVAAGWCNLNLGSYDLAAATFKAAAALNPQTDEPLVGQGSVALTLAQYPKATEFFNQALKLNPNSAMAYNGLGFLQLATKNRPQAQASFRKAVSLKSDDYSSQAALADMLLADKNYDQAAMEYEALRRMVPKAAPPVYGLAWVRYSQGQLDEAGGLFKQAADLNPYLAVPYYGQGLVAAKKGDAASAKKHFATAIAIAPGYAASPELLDLIKKNGWNDLLADLAWGFYYQRAYLAAIPYFEQASQMKPDRALNAGLGWSSLWVGQRDKAAGQFQGLLAADAKDYDGLLGSAMVEFQRNNPASALALLDKLLAAKSNDLGALRLVASLHQRENNLKAADEATKKIAALLPLAPDTYNQEGWALYAERRYTEAADKFKASLQLSTVYAAPHYGLGLSLLKQGDVSKAKGSLITAIYLDPTFMDKPEMAQVAAGNSELKDLASHTAWAYYYQFNADKAKAQFQKILAADPANRDALQGLGTVAYMTGDYPTAVASLSKLVGGISKSGTVWDNNSYILDNLGWSQFYTKAYVPALATFKRLEAYHPEVRYIASLNGQGWALLRKGDKAGAKALFQKSLEIVPENYVAKSGLAETGGK
jgi:tetratricopeptide (TPR) repeat protein